MGDRPLDTYYSVDIADYFAVHVLVLLDNERIVKPFIVVRNLGGGLAGIAKVRVVCFWMHPDESPLATEHGFSDCGDDDVMPPSSPERVHSCRFGPGGGTTFVPNGCHGPPRSGGNGLPLELSARAACLVGSYTHLCLS